jgi:ATP-dependent DNA ligase
MMSLNDAADPGAVWVYERKEDGWRMLAYKDGDRMRLVSRNGRHHAARLLTSLAPF